MQKVTELQKQFIDIDKKQFSNKKRKLYGIIHYPSISHSEISVTLRDEGLTKSYHFVSQYDVLLFDTTGSFVSLFPWLRNGKGEKKRILFYALMARLPPGGSLPITVLKHITSKRNAFSVRQPIDEAERRGAKNFWKT